DRDRAQHKSESPSAKFAGDHRGLDHQKRRRQRRDEANAAQRVPKYSAAYMDQKGNQRRLVDIAPAEMIAAGHVIELIAEIAVSAVEAKMQKEFGKGKDQNDQHAAGEKRLWILLGDGGTRRGACHGERSRIMERMNLR